MSKKRQAKVIKRFRNKYSKSLHKVGDLLDLSQSRYKEINSAGHGKLVEWAEEETVEEK